MEVSIRKQWDGQETGHEPISLTLCNHGPDVRIEIHAPYFGDPPSPPGPAGKPFNGLWDYEGS